MDQGTILWLGLLLVLAVAVSRTLRRTTHLVHRTRDLEDFQEAAEALGIRLAGVTAPLVRELDALRRHAGDPGVVGASLPAARDELDRLAAEGQALAVPRGMERIGKAMVEELARAVRAVDVVAHGIDVLGDSRRGREAEAQTSLKRGTLNLRHATEAFTRLVSQAKAVQPVDLAGNPPPAIAPDEPGPGMYAVAETEDI
jgi:hypothetical protein